MTKEKDIENNIGSEDYGYSAIIEYEGDEDDPTIIHITGRGICP